MIFELAFVVWKSNISSRLHKWALFQFSFWTHKCPESPRIPR